MRSNVSYAHHSVDVNLQSRCFGLSLPRYKRILCPCWLCGVSRGKVTLVPDRENLTVVRIAWKIKLILQGAWRLSVGAVGFGQGALKPIGSGPAVAGSFSRDVSPTKWFERRRLSCPVPRAVVIRALGWRLRVPVTLIQSLWLCLVGGNGLSSSGIRPLPDRYQGSGKSCKHFGHPGNIVLRNREATKSKTNAANRCVNELYAVANGQVASCPSQ